MAETADGTPIEGAPRPRAYVLTAGDPENDPRIRWVAGTLAARFDVCELGLHRDLSSGRAPRVSTVVAHHTRIHLPATPWPAYVADTNQAMFGDNDGWNALAGFAYEASSSDRMRPSRATRERHEHLRRILRTNVSLIRAARALGPAELIVAADVEALAAGAALKHEFGARLIYDAHEFWPYSFPQFSGAEEEQAWVRIERKLLRATDARFVVSPGLAEAMQKEYGVDFLALPNAAPLSDALLSPPQKNTSNQLEFLFLGGFAPERGLKLLIEAWSQTPANCTLVLQGPENSYKRDMTAAAKRTGLLGTRILFPPAIPEAELINRAARADVGLVPYEPTLINHTHCSPNKLSQYMAAGLPILANNTRFVADIVQRGACGLVVDFRDGSALASAVGKLAMDAEERQRLGLNARHSFETFFNWDAYAHALDAAAGSPKYPTQRLEADPQSALNVEFQMQPWRPSSGAGSTIGGFGKSVLRLALQAAWHGVPFLRVIMLNNPRFRRRAEELREL